MTIAAPAVAATLRTQVPPHMAAVPAAIAISTESATSGSR